MLDRVCLDSFCHYDPALKKHLVCPAFYFAEKTGEIVPNRITGTWELPASFARYMTWDAKHNAEQRGMTDDHSGDHYQLWDCPWCGGETTEIPRPRIARGES